VEAFHGLAAISLLIFLAGLAERSRIWLKAAALGPPVPANRFRHFLFLAGQGLSTLLTPRNLRALLLDGLVVRRLWRVDRVSWLVHFSVSWSFVCLFAVGSLGNMAADLGAPLEKDDPWFAALNESLGLALIAGVAVALARRYVFRGTYRKTTFEDGAVLAALALLALGGLLLETVRYLKEATPASAGGYAFVGYPLTQAVEPLSWDWPLIYDWLWWSHSLMALCLVAWLPYSKLFHMIASPLVIALSTSSGAPEKPALIEGKAAAWPA
jgi:nitrate reductase gamma subunit